MTVPFSVFSLVLCLSVGKDVPSPSSEYSHPDIKCGLTILAYRYEGLRRSDFMAVLTSLHEEMAQELLPFNKRRANIKFATWVALAGGRVRGWNRQEEEEKQRKKEKRQQAERLRVLAEEQQSSPSNARNVSSAAASTPHDVFFAAPSAASGDLDLLSNPVNYSGTMSTGSSGSTVRGGTLTPTSMAAGAAGILSDEADNSDSDGRPLLWPLQLVEFGDQEQIDMLFNLLFKQPHISYYYLTEFIFDDTLRHQGLKVSERTITRRAAVLHCLASNTSAHVFVIVLLVYCVCSVERVRSSSRWRYVVPTSFGFLWHPFRFASAGIGQVSVRTGQRRQDAALPHVSRDHVYGNARGGLDAAYAPAAHCLRVAAGACTDRHGRVDHRHDEFGSGTVLAGEWFAQHAGCGVP
jgi:hypothetical protein